MVSLFGYSSCSAASTIGDELRPPELRPAWDPEADDGGGDDGGSGTMDTSGEAERTPHTPFNVVTGSPDN